MSIDNSIDTAERRKRPAVRGNAIGKVRGRPHIFGDEVRMASASSGNSSPSWEHRSSDIRVLEIRNSVMALGHSWVGGVAVP